MTKVQEIEDAVQTLSREEFRILFDWMSKQDNDIWDQQFENDVISGKLDAMGDAALAEFNEGKCKVI